MPRRLLLRWDTETKDRNCPDDSELSETQFSRDNHCTPCVYLKAFSGPGKAVSVYRTLVSRPEVPLWKKSSTRSIAYLSHLYTRIAEGLETDEIESWLKHDFEDPAAEPLEKATSGAKLTPKDWTHLVRFLAAQMVRTPAYLVENRPRWQAEAPVLLSSTLQDVVQLLEVAKESGQAIKQPEGSYGEYLPIRVSTRNEPERETAQLSASMVVGRGSWLFSMRTVLAGSAKILHNINSRFLLRTGISTGLPATIP